ncbi:MAG TPA: hypothetical protein VGL38_16325 [bacterium]|jgi:hypothetical protein
MSYSVTQALYDWLHEKRLIRAVARDMGISESTLAARLCPNRDGKLGADDMVPLFQAIRRIGYGAELNGILHQYIAELKGDELANVADQDLIPHVLKLSKSLGILSDCAARISQISDEDELASLNTMLRTEVLPVVMKMENTISSRIVALRKSKRRIQIEVIIRPQEWQVSS